MKRVDDQKKRTLGKPLAHTIFVVRDSNSRRYLNQRVYSGRIRGIWGLRNDAVVFYSAAQARSSASNINHRRPEGYSAFRAEVKQLTLLVYGHKAQLFIELLKSFARESRKGKRYSNMPV